VFRLTSGRNTVNNLSDSGVILGGGLTVKDLQDMLQISPGPGFNRYWIDPKLLGPDGRANSQYLQVPTAPGEFGQFVYLYAKNNVNLDLSLTKAVPLPGRTAFTFWLGAFNVLNNPIWSTPGFLSDTSIQSQTFGQTTGPVNGARSMQVRAGITF
jgi:hypothetical protein